MFDLVCLERPAVSALVYGVDGDCGPHNAGNLQGRVLGGFSTAGSGQRAKMSVFFGQRSPE